MTRIIYEGQEYPVDADEVKSPEDAIAYLRPFAPRVVGGEVEVDVKDGETIYRVTARAEGKGGGMQAMLSVLSRAKHFIHPAIRMAREMEKMDEFQVLLERDRIREAFEQGREEYQAMEEIRDRLRSIRPVTGADVPAGF